MITPGTDLYREIALAIMKELEWSGSCTLDYLVDISSFDETFCWEDVDEDDVIIVLQDLARMGFIAEVGDTYSILPFPPVELQEKLRTPPPHVLTSGQKQVLETLGRLVCASRYTIANAVYDDYNHRPYPDTLEDIRVLDELGYLFMPDKGAALFRLTEKGKASLEPKRAYLEATGDLPTSGPREASEPAPQEPEPNEAGAQDGCLCRECTGEAEVRPLISSEVIERAQEAGKASSYGKAMEILFPDLAAPDAPLPPLHINEVTKPGFPPFWKPQDDSPRRPYDDVARNAVDLLKEMKARPPVVMADTSNYVAPGYPVAIQEETTVKNYQNVDVDTLETIASTAVLGTLLMEKLGVSPVGRNFLINILKPWVEVRGGVNAQVDVKGGVLTVVQESVNTTMDHWLADKIEKARLDWENESDNAGYY